MLRLALLCVWSLSAVQAYFNFQQKLPNGDRVPHPCQPNKMWQGVGHKNVAGSGTRNSFGVDFAANDFKWDRCLCQRDSDSDGRTNGEELGDPDCVWSEGGIPQITDMLKLSHPGVCEPVTDPKCMQINDWSFCDSNDKFECDTLEKEKPEDVTAFEIRYPTTPIPAKETTYYCMTFDVPNDAEYHLIADEPIIDNRQAMHHIVLYGCDEAEDGNTDWKITQPTRCGMGMQRCSKIIALWTVGVNGRCIPEQYGIRLGMNGFKTVNMQVHWNNPELRSDMTDNSGMILHLSKKLRPNDGATLQFGTNFLHIPPQMDMVSQEGSCTSECTKRLTGTMYIKELIFHMHYLGRSGVIEHKRDGKVLKAFEAKYYSYDNPDVVMLEEALEFQPGDELKITCNYKSTSRTTATYNGDGTSDEMCYGFATYYPAQADFSQCTSFRSLSTCPPGFDVQPKGNCNQTNFFADAEKWMTPVLTACQVPVGCTEQCRQAINQQMMQQPCLQGDLGLFYQYMVISKFFGEFGKPFVEAWHICDEEEWDRTIIYHESGEDKGPNMSIDKKPTPTYPPGSSNGQCVFDVQTAGAGAPWVDAVSMMFMMIGVKFLVDLF